MKKWLFRAGLQIAVAYATYYFGNYGLLLGIAIIMIVLCNALEWKDELEKQLKFLKAVEAQKNFKTYNISGNEVIQGKIVKE